jgi:hypothetical protein
VWEEIGGYWDGFVGWRGGASYLCFKLNMLDKAVYLAPTMRHWHFSGNIRDYKTCRVRISESSGKCLESLPFTATSFNSVHDMLCVANIIGGNQWARKVADSLQRKETPLAELMAAGLYPERLLPKNLYDFFFARALKYSDAHAHWFASKRKRTLDEQLEKFSREGVAFLERSHFPSVDSLRAA